MRRIEAAAGKELHRLGLAPRAVEKLLLRPLDRETINRLVEFGDAKTVTVLLSRMPHDENAWRFRDAIEGILTRDARAVPDADLEYLSQLQDIPYTSYHKPWFDADDGREINHVDCKTLRDVASQELIRRRRSV